MQTRQPSDNTPDDPNGSHARSGIAVFEVLVSEHADMLEAYLRSLLGQSNDLDDIFQETMLVAYRRLEDFDRNRPFGAWLRGIARILVMEYARKSRARPRTSDPAVLEAIDHRFEHIDTRDGDSFNEKISQLTECIDRLPQSMKQAIEMVYMREMTVVSASRSLQVGEEAMKKRLQRSRGQLARCLGINNKNG